MAESQTAALDVLEFSTKPARRSFKVDGTEYGLKNPNELTMSQSQRIAALAPVIDSGRQPNAATPEQAKQAELAAKEYLQIIVISGGDKVAERLTDDQKIRLVLFFLNGGSSPAATDPPEPATPNGNGAAKTPAKPRRSRG